MVKRFIKAKKAFSVAEAMIALLIGSVALATAAPIISKQVKFNNTSDTQIRVLLERIEELENRIEPEGMVAFFNLERCPSEWTSVPNDWANHFLMIKSTADTTRTIGSTELDSLPNIKGSFPWQNGYEPPEIVDEMTNSFYTDGSANQEGISGFDNNNDNMIFDASRSSSVYGRLGHGDLRPKNVALIACVKI